MAVTVVSEPIVEFYTEPLTRQRFLRVTVHIEGHPNGSPYVETIPVYGLTEEMEHDVAEAAKVNAVRNVTGSQS